MKKRFQIKITGSETATLQQQGRIVGWKLEFYSCQPAPVMIVIQDKELPIDEGLLIPKGAKVKFSYKGPVTATASVLLVLEEV